MKRPRLVGIAALILVILTSTYGYGQFSTPTVNGSMLGPEQTTTTTGNLPPVTPLCPNGMDLSTGTNGAVIADAVGTKEGVPPSTLNRWVVSGPSIAGTVAAISVKPVSPQWVTAPYVAPTGGPNGGTPPNRINWISYGTTSTPSILPAGAYTYSITFTTPPGGGTFYLYAFTADNSAKIQLAGPTAWGPWNTGSYPSGTNDVPDYNTWWAGTGTSGLNIVGPGTFTLSATVDNAYAAPSSKIGSLSGLAVYSVFCPLIRIQFAYAVKFLCNNSTNATAARSIGLEPGFYQTDINIHNPSYSTTNEPILLKFVVAQPENPSVGPPPISQIVPAVPTPYVTRSAILQPDAAMRLDCNQILTVLSNPRYAPQVAKGFVIIYSDTNLLDVWAEYTTLGATAGSTPAIEIVTVNPQKFTP